MEDEPGTTAGASLTDEQRAFLTAQAAQHAVSTPSSAAEQAATAAQMTERGPSLPAEDQMEQLMAAFKAQSAQIAALMSQVDVMQKQADERQAAEGGPPVIRYAQAAAEKIAATKVAHPDLPQGHFDEPSEAAAALVDAATALSKQGGSADALQSAAARIERWVTKTHWRTGRKFIDFSALADDVETAIDEALKLAA